MAFMLQARWHIAEGRIDEFRANQEALCKVMQAHPGVIAYHVAYPEPDVSEWIEIYANDDAFRAHLADEAGKAPLAAVAAACDAIECRCFGDPDPASRAILAGFGMTYHDSGPHSFVLNPCADIGQREPDPAKA